jgi:hypothetical protein
VSNAAPIAAPPSAAGAPPAAPPPGTVVRPPPKVVDYAALAAKASEGVKGAPVAEAPPPAAATPGAETSPAEGGTPVETPAAAAAPLDAKAVAAAVVAGRKHQEKLRQQAAAARRQADQAAREAQQYRQQAADNGRLLEQLRAGGDPSAALQALGVSPEELAKAAIASGTPAAQVKALQDQIAKERQEREALVRNLQARDQAAARAKAEETFYQAAQDEKRYPNLSKQPKAVILQMGDYLANQASAKGERFTFGDLLESLEFLYKGESKATPQATTQATTVSAGTGGSSKPPTRTITNADTSSSASTPVDLRSLPPAARYREIEKRALELAKTKK